MRCDCFLEIIDRSQHRIGCSEHFVELFQGSGLQGDVREMQKIPFFQREREREQEVGNVPVPKSLAL